MKKSFLFTTAIALLLSISASVVYATDDDAGNCTGACAFTRGLLKDLDDENVQEEYAKVVGNTFELLSEEQQAKLQADREAQSEKAKQAREEQRRAKEAERELQKAAKEQQREQERQAKEEQRELEKLNRQMEKDQKKREEIQKKLEECEAQAKATFGENTQNAQIMCKAQQKKALLDAGLTEDADQIEISAEDLRIADETKAAIEYQNCVKKRTNSEAACRKQLDKAYEQAKEDYYRNADPEKAKEEINKDYERCKAESTGGSRSQIDAYCKAKTKETYEKVGLTDDEKKFDLTSEERKAAKEVQAEQDYDKCVKETKSEAKCSKQLDAAYDQAKLDYYREEPDQAKADFEQEYQNCKSQFSGSRGDAYCKAKNKESLEKVGLTDDSNKIDMTLEEQRAAKEVQAEQDYEKCTKEKGASSNFCSKKLNQSLEDAKLDYYRQEPEKARQEIDYEYNRCRSVVGGNLPTEVAKCNQQRDTMLRRAGLVTNPKDNQPQGVIDEYVMEEHAIREGNGQTDGQVMANGTLPIVDTGDPDGGLPDADDETGGYTGN